MSDKMAEVYDTYDMEIYQTARGRGATILKTDKGIFQLKALDSGESRLKAEYQFKEKLFEMEFENIDRCVMNTQEELVTYDRYGNPFVMRRFFEGKECNYQSIDDILLAVENLAKLHIACRQVFNVTEGDVHIRSCGDFRKRNTELKRVRNFIGRQSPKKSFEDMYVRTYDYFFEQAVQCEKKLSNDMNEEMKSHLGYCHGMYNQHSVLIWQGDDGNNHVATINFDKFYVGNQLNDLYHFSRKMVEKNNYSFDVLCRILRKYGEICPLSETDIEYIYNLYCYPEKFYKLSNQYINGPKNWISPKMSEKLEKMIQDESDKKRLLNMINMNKLQLKSI